MVFKSTKRILTVIVAGVMVVGASVTSFAAGGVDGAGIVEYDNSEAISYDKIGVQTLVASDYDFTLDPTGQLHRYAPSLYDAGTVYFDSYVSRAYIQGVTPDGGSRTKLYKKGYAEATNTSGVYADVVTAFDTDNVTIKTIAAGPFYVYVPDEDNAAGYDAGFEGKYVAVTADNINKYFVISGAASALKIEKRQDNLAGPDVFDGKLYVDSYTEYTDDKITDSDLDPITNYVTLNTDGDDVTAVVTGANLYKEGTTTGTYVAATNSDIAFTKAVMRGNNSTKTHTVENMSTHAKTVKAVVTISNVKGITFQNTSTFESDDKSASMYLAATNGTGAGTTTVPLVASADGETATATYSVDLAAPTVSEITYMSDDPNTKTGGHMFYRYEGSGTTYGTDVFYLTAAANPNGKDAWDAWAATIASADDRPAVNIVYTVETKVTDAAPSIATTTYTMVSGQQIEIAVDLGLGSSAATGVESVKWSGVDLLGSKVTYANGKVTITAAAVTNLIGVSGDQTVVITFNDTAKTTVNVTLTH